MRGFWVEDTDWNKGVYLSKTNRKNYKEMQGKFIHKISGRGEGSGPKCLINSWSEYRLAQTEK